MKPTKIIAVFLVATLCTLLFVGCSPAPSSSSSSSSSPSSSSSSSSSPSSSSSSSSPSSSSSSSSSSSMSYIVYDENDIRITLKSLKYNSSIYGPNLTFLVENNTDQDLIIQCRRTSVNGYTMSPLMSIDVNRGQKAYGDMTFFKNDLEQAGIIRIQTVETYFHVCTSSFSTYLDTPTIQMHF